MTGGKDGCDSRNDIRRDLKKKPYMREIESTSKRAERRTTRVLSTGREGGAERRYEDALRVSKVSAFCLGLFL